MFVDNFLYIGPVTKTYSEMFLLKTFVSGEDNSKSVFYFTVTCFHNFAFGWLEWLNFIIFLFLVRLQFIWLLF